MKNERKQVILQTLAKLLETRSPSKVTTALLAKSLGLLKPLFTDIFQARDVFFLNYLIFVMIQLEQKLRS